MKKYVLFIAINLLTSVSAYGEQIYSPFVFDILAAAYAYNAARGYQFPQTSGQQTNTPPNFVDPAYYYRTEVIDYSVMSPEQQCDLLQDVVLWSACLSAAEGQRAPASAPPAAEPPPVQAQAEAPAPAKAEVSIQGCYADNGAGLYFNGAFAYCVTCPEMIQNHCGRSMEQFGLLPQRPDGTRTGQYVLQQANNSWCDGCPIR